MKKKAESADTRIATAELSKETTTPKKEGGFQIPSTPTFDKTMQEIKEIFKIDTTKKELPSADTEIQSVAPSKETTTPKKEEEFQMPKIPSFDKTIQEIKEIFRIDATKKEQSSADTGIGNVEQSKETNSPKKEGGFQLPTIPSFESTIQGIKETLRIDTAKKELSSVDTAIESVEQTIDMSTPKKEGGSQLPTIPLFDSAIQGIKETFRIGSAKNKALIEGIGIESGELSKEMTSPKKEGGFQMPSTPSFDKTMQEIKEIFKIDTTKKELPSVDTEIESVAPSKETTTPKKEEEFQMPKISSFDKTIQEIKEIFRIDAMKREQSSADTGIGSVEQSKETNSPKKEGGFQLPTIPS
ncbi:unnamed protein product, partial [Rotaria sp. Silwood1]